VELLTLANVPCTASGFTGNMSESAGVPVEVAELCMVPKFTGAAVLLSELAVDSVEDITDTVTKAKLETVLDGAELVPVKGIPRASVPSIPLLSPNPVLVIVSVPEIVPDQMSIPG
jgi:hypothetical protein